MARGLQKLSALAVSKASKAGLYGDGAGLWLQVSPAGAKSWLFRYMRHGKAREMGLGALHTVSLAEAREKARQCRVMLLEGKDPLAEKQAARQQERLTAAKTITFSECASAYVEAHRAGWRSAKHAAQWEATLKAYAYPAFEGLSVAAIDTGLVLQCLEPIWKEKTETASRLRGRIESVLDWAKVRGYREGENPARWRGHLDKLLPARSKVAKVQHHPSLPYADIPEFMEALRQREGIAPLALEFAILTATRTSEAIKATWQEIDLQAGIWIIPGERMKAGKEHRVPLSSRALEILHQMQALTQGEYVFPGMKYGKPLSNMALLMTLRRMGQEHVTHGLRATFRTWTSETTAYPSDVAEMALAHTISDKVEAAYQRGDLFLKRQRLMEDWATYCTTPRGAVKANIVGIRGKA
jgi:integrase